MSDRRVRCPCCSAAVSAAPDSEGRYRCPDCDELFAGVEPSDERPRTRPQPKTQPKPKPESPSRPWDRSRESRSAPAASSAGMGVALLLGGAAIIGAGVAVYVAFNQPAPKPVATTGFAKNIEPPPEPAARPQLPPQVDPPAMRPPTPKVDPPAMRPPAPKVDPPAARPPAPKVEPPAAVEPPAPEDELPEPEDLPAPKIEPPHVPKGAPEEVKLPGPVTDVGVGGGGRFLIFQFAGKRKLAVFDTALAKVVKELSLAEETTLVAAGRNRLVAIYPGARIAQFWDLTTFEKERVAPLPDALTKNTIHQVCMGAACDETLFAYIAPEKRTLAVALDTMKATEVRWNHWGPGGAYGPQEMRASGDGSVLTGRGGGWAGCDVALFARGKQVGVCAKIPFWNAVNAAALPTADGRYVFASGHVLDRALVPTAWAVGKDAYVVPGVEPGFVLVLAGAGTVGSGYRSGHRPTAISVYSEDRQKLFALGGLDEVVFDTLPWEKQVFYYPRSGLLLTLAPGRERLVLRRVDLGEELERTGADYLAVTSRPPRAVTGKPFEYQVEVRSKRGRVKYKLEVGPDGMTVDGNGMIVWNEPARLGQPAKVVLVVSDASGQDVIHSFVLGAKSGFSR